VSQSNHPATINGAMEILSEMFATFGMLPETVGPTDVDSLNSVMAALLAALRHAAVLRADGKYRESALLALRAVELFILRLKPGFEESLNLALGDVTSGLVALEAGQVVPLLKPKPRPRGGRAPEDPTRHVLLGCAVAAVGRLQWTGLRIGEAQSAVAERLDKLGVKPARGSRPITSRTVREWCEKIAADVGGRSMAAVNVKILLSPESESRVRSMPRTEARKLILEQLALIVRLHPDWRGGTGKPS